MVYTCGLQEGFLNGIERHYVKKNNSQMKRPAEAVKKNSSNLFGGRTRY
jgi:hypothetical protein